VSGYCKSAGTLIALGANELAFGEHGELGPLDVQIAKRDEVLGLVQFEVVMP
jgi:ClpP class serine protease